MAKRTTPPRSQADDAAAAATPSQPRPRRARASKSAAASVENNGTNTFTASASPDEVNRSDRADSGPDDNESTSMSSEPSEHDIRIRAYHRYLEHGGGHGLHFDDWLEAERE